MGTNVVPRLDVFCLIKGLEFAAEKFEDSEDPSNQDRALYLWKYCKLIIPLVFEEAGRKAIQLMEVMTYLCNDSTQVRILQEDHYRHATTLRLLRSIGLVKSELDPFWNLDFHDYESITLHSPTLVEHIRKINNQHEKEYLRGCLTHFNHLHRSEDEFFRIWTLAMKYTDLFKEFHRGEGIYYFYIRANKNPERKQLLSQALTKYKEVYGQFYEETILLNVFHARFILENANENENIELKWKEWEDSAAQELEDILKIQHNWTNSQELIRTISTMICFADNQRIDAELKEKILTESARLLSKLNLSNHPDSCARVADLVFECLEKLGAINSDCLQILVPVLLENTFVGLEVIIERWIPRIDEFIESTQAKSKKDGHDLVKWLPILRPLYKLFLPKGMDGSDSKSDELFGRILLTYVDCLCLSGFKEKLELCQVLAQITTTGLLKKLSIVATKTISSTLKISEWFFG